MRLPHSIEKICLHSYFQANKFFWIVIYDHILCAYCYARFSVFSGPDIFKQKRFNIFPYRKSKNVGKNSVSINGSSYILDAMQKFISVYLGLSVIEIYLDLYFSIFIWIYAL